MAKILLDACVPQWLRTELSGSEVTTAHYAMLDQLSDSQLLDAAEGRYDVLVTLDRSIPHQQQIAGRRLAVIVLRVQDQTPESFRALVPALVDAINEVKPGEVRELADYLDTRGL
jgi:predicted nuclease of predicted toxin-antitoxin system